MGSVGGVHIDSNNFSNVVDAEGLREDAVRKVQLEKRAEADVVAVVLASFVNVKTTDFLRVVDAGSLRALGSQRKGQDLKDVSRLVEDVGEIGRSVGDTLAEVAGCLSLVVLSQKLVEDRTRLEGPGHQSRIVDRHVWTCQGL